MEIIQLASYKEESKSAPFDQTKAKGCGTQLPSALDSVGHLTVLACFARQNESIWRKPPERLKNAD
jgi:hypothetical protein